MSLHCFKLSEMKDPAEVTEECDVIRFSILKMRSLRIDGYVVTTQDGALETKGAMTIKNTGE